MSFLDSRSKNPSSVSLLEMLVASELSSARLLTFSRSLALMSLSSRSIISSRRDRTNKDDAKLDKGRGSRSAFPGFSRTNGGSTAGGLEEESGRVGVAGRLVQAGGPRHRQASGQGR